MAWTSLSFSVGQVLTAAQMNNLQANFASMAANEVGAPDIANLDTTAITAVTISSSGTQNIAASGTWVPGVGIYNFQPSNTLVIAELYIGGAWKTVVSGQIVHAFFLACDGTNMRFHNISGSTAYDVYYQKVG